MEGIITSLHIEKLPLRIDLGEVFKMHRGLCNFSRKSLFLDNFPVLLELELEEG